MRVEKNNRKASKNITGGLMKSNLKPVSDNPGQSKHGYAVSKEFVPTLATRKYHIIPRGRRKDHFPVPIGFNRKERELNET